MTKFFGMTIAAAALAFAGQAAASVNDEKPQAMVQYSDLDLSSDEGQKMLDRRIGKAARDACTYAQATGTRLTRNSGCEREVRAKLKVRFAEVVRNARSGG